MNVSAAKDHAEVVFRATITAIRNPQIRSTAAYRETKEIIGFRVSRVWKGDVGENFEMPALVENSMCYFGTSILKVGTDVLVYAKRVQGQSEYHLEPPCLRTALAKNAKDYFDELGPGEEPKKHEDPKEKKAK